MPQAYEEDYSPALLPAVFVVQDSFRQVEGVMTSAEAARALVRSLGYGREGENPSGELKEEDFYTIIEVRLNSSEWLSRNEYDLKGNPVEETYNFHLHEDGSREDLGESGKCLKPHQK